ncbi:MAG: PilZ domain-containing protein [Elusimicrobiota bacterium]
MRLTQLLRKTVRKNTASDPDPSASSNQERRRYARHAKEMDISLLDARRRPADEAVRLIDMSCGGLAIESSRQFAVGDTLGFQLCLGEGRPLAAMARVRWARPDGYYYAYGLKLEGMGYLARERLVRALNPRHVGFQEFATLFMQAAATMLGAYVVIDWISSDPRLLNAALTGLPWLLFAGAFAIGLWSLRHR